MKSVKINSIIKTMKRILWPALIIFFIFLLSFRRIDALTLPQFLAEDGTIFFQDSINLNFFESLFKTYSGYFHILPRLIAVSVLLIFKLEYAPLLYNISSIIISSIIASVFFLSPFKKIIKSNLLRIFVCTYIIIIPTWTGEMLINITYLQWYLFILISFISLLEFSADKKTVILLGLLILFGIFTTPTILLVCPVLIASILLNQNIRNKAFVFLLIVAFLGCISVLILKNNIVSYQHIIRLFFVRFFGNTFIGTRNVYHFFENINIFMAVIFICITIAMIFSWNYMDRLKRNAVIILSYYIFASFFMVTFFRISWFEPLNHNKYYLITPNDRYFSLGMVCVITIIAIIIEVLSSRLPLRVRYMPYIVPALIIVLVFQSDYKMGRFKDFQWKYYISKYEQRVNTGNKSYKIPINPGGWVIKLNK